MPTPAYNVRTDFRRPLAIQFMKIIGLCIVFYLGIFVNMKLLNKSPGLLFNLLVITVLGTLVVVQLVFTYLKAMKSQYLFYPDRIEYTGKKKRSIMLKDVANISIKNDFFDKALRTGTIVLEPGFIIQSIDRPQQNMFYIENLVSSARGMMQQQYAQNPQMQQPQQNQQAYQQQYTQQNE